MIADKLVTYPLDQFSELSSLVNFVNRNMKALQSGHIVSRYGSLILILQHADCLPTKVLSTLSQNKKGELSVKRSKSKDFALLLSIAKKKGINLSYLPGIVNSILISLSSNFTS